MPETCQSNARNMPIQITRLQPSHLADLNRIYNYYVLESSATFDLEPWSGERRREWFEAFGSTGPRQAFVALADGEVVGYAYSACHRSRPAYRTSVETSVYLHPEWHRHGIGTRLYQALFDALASEDLHRAYAGIALPNQGSIALHERFGFRQVGTYDEVGRKFERYWSVLWMEKEL